MDNPQKKWIAFLKDYPNAHILQTPSWATFKSHFGWDVSWVVCQNTGAQILFNKLPLGFSWAYLPKGPVGINWDQLWPFVHRECRRKNAVFLKVEPDGWAGESGWIEQNMEKSSFRSSSHQIQPARSLVVDLDSPEEEILSWMKQKTRYNIRLAARKGVEVKPAQGEPDAIRKFHYLLKTTGERDTFAVHNLAYYQKAYETFYPAGQCELFFAEAENILLAAIMVFATGGRSWYLYGASSNFHRNLMAPYAVQWKAMQWARSKGCSTYDLWGVPDQDYEKLESEFMQRKDGLWGVYRFKRGFGGQLKRSTGTWDRVYNPFLYLFYLLWVKKNNLDV